MRPYWVTIVLAAVLGALGAYLSYIEFPAEQTRLEEEKAAARIVSIDESDVTSLGIRSLDSDVRLELSPKRGWQITSPVHADANPHEVRAVIRALVLGTVSRVIQRDTKDLAPFGLDDPLAVLTIGSATTRETITLGDSGPITSTLYAMRATDRTVLLTTLTPKDFFNKTVMTFRKKEILDFDRATVQRIRLTYPQREFVLYRVDQGKTDSWRLRFPTQADADRTEVRGILFTLHELKAVGFIDPGGEYDRVKKTLTTPQVKVTLYDGGQDRLIGIYQPDSAGGEAFAVTDGDQPIYRVSPTVSSDLTKDLFTLRDKRLLGMDPEAIALLKVKTREHHYTLAQQNEAWILEDQPYVKLHPETVTLFVSRVTNLPAELQVLKRTGPLAPYGLASPSAVFTATDRQGRIAHVSLGKQASGLVYATGSAMKGLYQARADILDQIPSKKELLDHGASSQKEDS